MTANQINYFKAREERRSHLANEDIARDANRLTGEKVAVDRQNANTNLLLAGIHSTEALETARSNRARESETYRHNVASENELQRSNMQQELQKRNELNETIRTNLAREAETTRSNMASEDIRRESNYIDVMHNQELARSNMAAEAIRSAELAEKERSNRMGERQRTVDQQIDVARAQAQQLANAEQARHNVETETQTQYRDRRSLNQGAVDTATNFLGKLVPMALSFIGLS